MVLAETGEDFIASCDSCEYAANVEKAHCLAPEGRPKEPARPMEKVSTPGMKSVEEVTTFLKVGPERLVKTLIYLADGEPVAALVRGDHELNEIKLKNLLGVDEVALADKETVERVTAAPSGFAGPVGLKGMRVYADHAVEAMSNFVVGANEPDAHLTGVNAGRDFAVNAYADLRSVRVGDPCPRCGTGGIEIFKGIEVGHIFMLGTKYSEAMGCTYLAEDGSEKPMVMGCYGIGVGRTAAAAIEQNHDEHGIRWPAPIAPFTALVLPLNVNDRGVMEAAQGIYEVLKGSGVEVLMDDRDERAGSKFKDADLIGIPLRVVVGEKGLKEGVVEVKERSTGEVRKVAASDAAAEVVRSVRART
jgi:prolyl-tRNA synthetase